MTVLPGGRRLCRGVTEESEPCAYRHGLPRDAPIGDVSQRRQARLAPRPRSVPRHHGSGVPHRGVLSASRNAERLVLAAVDCALVVRRRSRLIPRGLPDGRVPGWMLPLTGDIAGGTAPTSGAQVPP